MTLKTQVSLAKVASRELAAATSDLRNRALRTASSELLRCADEILRANELDVKDSMEKGLPQPLVKRLTVSQRHLESMASRLKEIAELGEVVGEVIESRVRPDGLVIRKVRVPFGVVGVVYESRPDVTSDASGLCIKSGNAVLLRGGREAGLTNSAIVSALRDGLARAGLDPDCIQLVTDPDRSAVREMMTMKGGIDLLIPRGGKELITTVVANAKVPVIETGVGNCHAYVDRSADLDVAERVVVNAKCSNPAVCNAIETLLVHRDVSGVFLPRIRRALESRGVTLRGCPVTMTILPGIEPATEPDWETEYLDLVLAVKVVDDVDDAIAHIDRYGSGHSETIVARDSEVAARFQAQVDAACVYVNASTRFTDGHEFGMGAEIGISTQKLHARGPMGLKELTTYKYLIEGTGHVR